MPGQPAFACLQLLDSMRKRQGLRLEIRQDMLSAVRVVALKPRQAAMQQGSPVPAVFVVRSGLLKQQYVAADGTERIKSFTSVGDVFACVEALDGAPATFSSVAIEPSVVERVEFQAIEQLAREHADWQLALRLAFQQLAVRKIRRERDLLLRGPRELYAQLLDERPAWLARVPQKDLAGYLGVTPVGLNRIARDHGRTAAAGLRINRG